MRSRCRGVILALLAVCLCLAGCLELIRRPAPESGPGEPTTALPDTAALRPAAPARSGADQEAVARPAASSRSERDPRHQRDLEALNEYVFWCIGQGMWNEARSHLEKALQQDSLAASLHNNLGIVYERLGDSTRAAAAYQKARSLNPGNRAYTRNLELLEKRYKAESGDAPGIRIDSAVTRELVPAAEADSTSAPPHRESRYRR